jgi:hypothetical protein
VEHAGLHLPLAAQNHAELALPFFRYRRNSLPQAMSYAAENLKKPGAFYADVANRKGYSALGPTTNNNKTAGTSIALDMWCYYAFTRDEKFLKEMAWPVIREVTRFQASLPTLGEDGRYHVLQTSAYEGPPLFDDTITDLAMIRGLFAVAIRAGKMLGHDQAELARWQELLDKLTPFRMADVTEPEMERKGNDVGIDTKGQWIRNRYAHLTDKMAYYGLPDPELATVYPSDVIGLSQRGTDLFKAAVTQVRLHPTADIDPDSHKPSNMEGSADQCMGWCPCSIVLARLGLAEELAAELAHSVSTWQSYPQGFRPPGSFDTSITRPCPSSPAPSTKCCCKAMRAPSASALPCRPPGTCASSWPRRAASW